MRIVNRIFQPIIGTISRNVFRELNTPNTQGALLFFTGIKPNQEQIQGETLAELFENLSNNSVLCIPVNHSFDGTQINLQQDSAFNIVKNPYKLPNISVNRRSGTSWVADNLQNLIAYPHNLHIHHNTTNSLYGGNTVSRRVDHDILVDSVSHANRSQPIHGNFNKTCGIFGVNYHVYEDNGQKWYYTALRFKQHQKINFCYIRFEPGKINRNREVILRYINYDVSVNESWYASNSALNVYRNAPHVSSDIIAMGQSNNSVLFTFPERNIKEFLINSRVNGSESWSTNIVGFQSIVLGHTEDHVNFVENSNISWCVWIPHMEPQSRINGINAGNLSNESLNKMPFVILDVGDGSSAAPIKLDSTSITQTDEPQIKSLVSGRIKVDLIT